MVKVHKRMEFEIPVAFEKQDMGLSSKTEYMVLFHESRSQFIVSGGGGCLGVVRCTE